MIDEHGARRPNFAHDVMDRADHQCRNTTPFDHMRDETDGLMAKRSIGNQQGEIDFGLLQVIGDGRREFILYFFMLPQSAHE